MIEQRPITSRSEWLEWRKPFVTASQMPALFGAHPYLTALKLYLEKSGIEFPERDSKAMRRGRLLENSVALAAAEDRPEWIITPANAFFCDNEKRIAATPDFFINGDPRGTGILQAKTAAPAIFQREWSNGQAPFWVTLQALQEMMLTGAKFGAIAVLCVDPYDMACSIHEIERHAEAEARIHVAVDKFWDDVEHAREPEPDYGRDASLLKILAPREAAVDKAVDYSGDNHLPEILAERALLTERIKSDRSRCEEIETEIKFLMRDAAIIKGLSDWRVTWKTSHVKGYEILDRDVRMLRISKVKGELDG